jgi:hypothetical protein
MLRIVCPLVFAACASVPSKIVPAPALSGEAQLDAWVSAAAPDVEVTVEVVTPSGGIIASATAPSGDIILHVPVGRYHLRFAVAGTPAPACEVDVVLRSDQANVLGNIALPRGCTLWVPTAERGRHRGSLADVRVPLGDHDGVRIERCDARDPLAVLYVIGTGTLASAATDELRAALEAALVPMAGGVVPAERCRAGDVVTSGQRAGFTVHVSDYRQIDEVVARVAAILRARDLAIGVSIVLTDLRPRVNPLGDCPPLAVTEPPAEPRSP